MSRMRTAIEIEETYVQAIMNRYGVRTRTEAVDLALRYLAGQPMTREEALAMRARTPSLSTRLILGLATLCDSR
jgi:Arc/MetJ family transcription regulator